MSSTTLKQRPGKGTSSANEPAATPALTDADRAVAKKKKEGTFKKFMTRLIFGFILIFGTLLVIFSAHIYVAIFIVGCQTLVFRELVRVRYDKIKAKPIPLFRTLQWCWFFFAMFYVYSNQFYTWSLNHQQIGAVKIYLRYHDWVSFGMYSVLFAGTVLQLKEGSYRYQMGQLTWTCLTIAICVILCKQTFGIIFEGMIWFLLSISMVICNDTFAYFCGFSLGRKIINRPFLRLSPNKTWEGFIGGGICTVIFAYFWPLVWVQFQWLVCPCEEITFKPFQNNLACELDPVFVSTTFDVPSQLVFMFGETITCLPVQLHCMVLACYASVFAPFGGFLASAIKRAYGKNHYII